MAKDDATRVVGVYAYYHPGKVFLYENACVVAGSEDLIKQYMESLANKPDRGMKISKLRFGEIYDDLKTGAVYAFDRQSYTRFYSLGRRAGIDDLQGFPESPSDGLHLMKVQFNTELTRVESTDD